MAAERVGKNRQEVKINLRWVEKNGTHAEYKGRKGLTTRSREALMK